MKKLLLFILFVVTFGSTGFAQQIKKVQLISSQQLRGFPELNMIRVIKPVFSHENSTLAADSANFNQNQNTFEAFGNVVITQTNGTNVYSDHLNYDGNTRLALLTGNVRLVDGNATLTTDYLTYNMGTRIGTYTGGGKIVSGEDVLTSTNGYYFAASNDAYFRHNVVVNTPNALIKTDTLRYNSVSKIAYFYGPTNIFGKKDSSNLYTENGTYNTVTEQARFGKKNLYTQGSKSLKGDSLYYDGKAGFGRAINRITFIDTTQKVTLKGDLGLYKKIDESALVTKNAYVIFTTEDKGKVDSIYMAADTLYTRLIMMKDFKPIVYPVFGKEAAEQDSVVVQDSLKNDSIPSGKVDQDLLGTEQKVSATEGNQKKERKGIRGVLSKKTSKKDKSRDRIPPTTTDSNKTISPDTLLSDTVKVKNKDALVANETSGQKPDSAKALSAKNQKQDTVKTPGLDSAAKKPSVGKDTVKVVLSKADSLRLQDTTKTRIVLAYRKVKIFKSDLQGKADSIFYSYADSTMRCYVNPMIWADGSQLSADTIYMQLKNKTVDNILLRQKGFIVNTEADSARFNQVKGKTITGVFKEGKMNQLFVDGNAESIYFTREDSAYSGMNHLISSRMRMVFEDNKIQDIFPIKKPEGQYYPMKKIPKDKDILEGFIWKPKDRPRSKEEIIPSLIKPVAKKPVKPVAKPAGGKSNNKTKKPVPATSKKLPAR